MSSVRLSRLENCILGGIAVLLTLSFITCAAVRQLNFDEALALRSGYLLVERVPSSPPFYMPFTMILGAAGHAVTDPGMLFTLLRITVAVLLCLVLYLCFRALSTSIEVLLLSVILTLSQTTFVIHGLEFRYDWAILLGWLLALRLFLRPSAGSFYWLGILTSWLAAHQMKGVFYGSFLYLFSLGAIWVHQNSKKRSAVYYHAGLLSFLVLWFAVTLLLGNRAELTSTFSTFSKLPTEVNNVTVLDALWRTYLRDFAWWFLAFLSIILLGIKIIQRGIRKLYNPEILALMFSVPPLLFLYLHPHPWPYMLAFPVPFLAFIMASSIQNLKRMMKRITIVVGFLFLFCLQYLANGSLIWKEYVRSMRATRSKTVASLRHVKRFAFADDTVFDPSGICYFMKPFNKEWYLDSLFMQKLQQGTWMNYTLHKKTFTPDWILVSNRLNMLLPPTKEQIYTQYAPAGGSLLLNKNHRLYPILAKSFLPSYTVLNYW